MRIGSVFLLSIFLGSAIGVVAAVLFAAQQWSAFQAARDVEHDTRLLTSALSLPEMMNMERAFINPRLVEAGAATAEQLAPILRQTGLVDATIGDVRKLVTEPADTTALQTVQSRLLSVRSAALAAITQPKAERSSGSVDPYLPEMFAVQKMAYGLASTVHERINTHNPRVGQATRLALLAWDLRDWSGRQTTLFINYLAKHLPMDDEQAETLAIYKGRIEQKWEAARAFAATIDNPDVTVALADVERGFWSQGGEVYATRVVPNHGHILDTDPNKFVTFIRPVLDTILPLRDSALKEALREGNADIVVRRAQFLLALGLLLLTAGAASTATKWFDRRVLKPIGEITDIILALAGGDRDRMVPLHKWVRELGQMAEAIETLRCNAIQAQATANEMLALQKARVDEKSHLLTQLQQSNEELAALNVELEALAATDALTGVPNRRSFDLCLAREWRRAKRETTSLALLLLDVDYFKSFNDRYGHPSGDACLAKVAESVANAVRRPGDSTARYGGEEFAVILPLTDLDGAVYLAERVRCAIAALHIRHVDNPSGFVTASIGVSVIIPSVEGTADALLNSADTALYAAKRAGRNQVATQASSAVQQQAHLPAEASAALAERPASHYV